MSNVLIILGMHRSGTSLISGWLSKCNLNLGDRNVVPDTFNKTGYFEDLDFLDLHEEILEYYKINKTGLIPPYDFELDEDCYKKLKNNIELKNSLYKQWGWKEPRTCLFINYYRELLPSAKYLIVYRDYKFVVESLIRRDYIYINTRYKSLSESEQAKQYKYFKKNVERLQLFINVYLSAWIIYNQNIIDLTNSINDNDYVIIRYDKLIGNDNALFERLIQWGFKLKFSPFTSIFDPQLINEKLPDITFNLQLESRALEIKTKMMDLLNYQ